MSSESPWSIITVSFTFPSLFLVVIITSSPSMLHHRYSCVPLSLFILTLLIFLCYLLPRTAICTLTFTCLLPVRLHLSLSLSIDHSLFLSPLISSSPYLTFKSFILFMFLLSFIPTSSSSLPWFLLYHLFHTCLACVCAAGSDRWLGVGWGWLGCLDGDGRRGAAWCREMRGTQGRQEWS